MPIGDYPTLQAKSAAPWQRLALIKESSAAIASGRLSSLWQNIPFPGPPPGSAELLDRNHAGAVTSLFDSSGTQRLVQTAFNYGYDFALGGTAVLVDRLSHQGGLNGTTTTPQAANVPPSTLARYSDGVGVLAALEIYIALGSTRQSATVTYTNQAGVAGRTSYPVAIGGAGNQELAAVLPVCLASGDSGIRAVTNVSLSGSTGAIGNFGVTLYKPLLMFPLVFYPQATPVFDGVLEMFSQMPVILAGACLSWLFFPTSNISGRFCAELRLVEE